MVRDVKLDHHRTLVSKFIGASILWLMAMGFMPALVAAQANLLRNPDLTAGTGDTPQYWQQSAFAEPGDVTFEWLNDQLPAELEVFNYQPADSRWTQKLHLKPGWYHFTASVRTENVGEVDFGASISIMEGWIGSRQVRGTSYWEPVGFYLQLPMETDVTFACRLGLYSSMNTGRAFFRNLSATQVQAPANDDPSFKLGS